MTVYCHGDCHVWLGSSSLCTCLQGRLAKPDEAHRVAMMYGHPVNYNPFSPHAPQQPAPAPDVPLAQFNAAQAVNATHLSADGLIAYDQRQYSVYRCFWDEETRAFGSWFKCGELPAGAVVLK